MTYEECLVFLYERLPMFQRQGGAAYKKDLSNTIRLLDKLDKPQHSFKSIHIAGTNGKGSSAHALASIMQAAGYKTGLYTSPHLREFTERIRINGKEISQEAVIEFVEESRSVLEEIKPSFFEATVGMAFSYFARQEVDIAVVETGLGGRLDSTNVILPEVSLITRIGYDHMEFLGNTLELIAAEKAGIIKPGVPVVIGSDQPQLFPVFRGISQDRGSMLVNDYSAYQIEVKSRTAEDVSVTIKYNGRVFLDSIQVDIGADYFLDNLAGVLSVIRVLQKLDWTIDEAHIKSGLAVVKRATGLKGRYQILGQAPLMIADVSHNEDGIRALLKQAKVVPFDALRVIYGAVKDKDIEKILRLFPAETKFYFAQPDIPRAMTIEELSHRAGKIGIEASADTNVNRLLERVRKESSEKDVILITGSTFVVAELQEL